MSAHSNQSSNPHLGSGRGRMPRRVDARYARGTICSMTQMMEKVHLAGLRCIKRTIIEATLLNNIMHVELIFDCKPRILPRHLCIINRCHGQNQRTGQLSEKQDRKIRLALEKPHQRRPSFVKKANNTIVRQSAGTVTYSRCLILINASESNIDQNGRGGKLEN